MSKVLSIIFWLYFAVSCVRFFGVALLLRLITAPFDRQARANHLFSCAWAYSYWRVNPGSAGTMVGREKILKDKAYVIVANHTSMADIVLCFSLFRQFKFMSKASMFNVPVLGWNMRLCRYIPLHRGQTGSIKEAMALSEKWLNEGMSVVMFPEGTRSPDGKLKPFKHGAFTLALDTGVPVVPVVIHGGHEVLAKHGHRFKSKAVLNVEVLDPIPPTGFESANAYSEAVRERICQALGEDHPNDSA